MTELSTPTRDAIVRVVDDDAAMCRSIAYLLESVGWTVAAYASAEAFIADGDRSAPGCLVLDVRMPTMSGLQLQQALASDGAALPIVFVTAHGDVAMAVEAMKSGASDFIEKPFKEQALLDAVARAVRRSVEAAARRGDADRLAQLTGREREVARLIALGLSSKEIGRRLGISDKTVQVHRNHLMEKLGAHSAAEVTRRVLQAGPDGPA